jgi:heme oxygenase
VAHHYTRYLGDLSGGFPIGRVVAATYGLSADDGGRFAHFPEIDDPARFKDDYRTWLNEAPWSEQERSDLIDEVHAAYRCNVEVYSSLDHHAG